MASRLLPLNRRRAARVVALLFRELYGCVSPRAKNPLDVHRHLNDWRIWLLRSDRPLQSHLEVALHDTLHRFRLPIDPLVAAIDQVEQVAIASGMPLREATLMRADGLGAPLGELMLMILGGHDQKTLPHARGLGSAVMLTNLLTDLGEGLRTGGIRLSGPEQSRVRLADLSRHADSLLVSSLHGLCSLLRPWNKPFVRAVAIFHRARLLKIDQAIRAGSTAALDLTQRERVWLGAWALLGMLPDQPDQKE